MLVSRSLDARKNSSGLRLAFRNKKLVGSFANPQGHAIIAFFQKLKDAGGTQKTRHAAQGGLEIRLASP
jgi:hypothetical protein